MNRSTKKAGIVRASLKSSSGTSVIIGGPDGEYLESKQAILEQKIEEARQRAEIEAEKILAEASENAKRIIEDAEQQKSEIEASAYQEGFNKGALDATNHIHQEMATTLKEMALILQSIEQERQECLEDEEVRVFKIIIAIAKELLKKDYELNQNLSIEFIKAAIKKLDHKSSVNIIINAEVANKINKIKQDLINEIPGLENLSITASENQKLGDLIVESNKERLDLRLNSILEELALSVDWK